MKKKKYDTSVVMLYLLGKERLLPPAFRRQIPFSTISSWRRVDYSTYIGHQYRFLFEENWDLIVLREQLQKLKKQLYTIAKAWHLLKKDIGQWTGGAKKDQLLQKKLVATVDLLKKAFGIKTAIKLVGLKLSQYREWKMRENLCCTTSEKSLCLRRFPNQLCAQEIRKIRALLSSPRFGDWPVISIAAYAQRRGFLMVSAFSWYKYARILNLQHKINRKQKRMVGLVATAPNEYWHADTTYYYISDTRKVCITIVMDNFSKMVLGFAVNEKLCFTLIKEALTAAICVATQQKKDNGSILVTDGGKENRNGQVYQFLATLTNYRLSPIIALKDIQFSNSPVEAIHKILKSRYLKNRKFTSIDEFLSFLHASILNYNTIRPHCRHGLRTPDEVYNSVPLSFNPKEKLISSIKDRIQRNKRTSCKACLPLLAHGSTPSENKTFYIT